MSAINQNRFSLFSSSSKTLTLVIPFTGEQHCKIAPLCTVPAFTTLPDFTVVYGNNERRVEKPGLEPLRAEAREKHVDVLKALATAAVKAGKS